MYVDVVDVRSRQQIPDGVVEVLCCEGGSEVGGVGGDHDEGEQVPHARYEPADGDQER